MTFLALHELRLLIIRSHPAQLLPHLHLVPVLPPVRNQPGLLVHYKISRARPMPSALCRFDPVVLLADVRARRLIAERDEVFCARDHFISYCMLFLCSSIMAWGKSNVHVPLTLTT